MTIRIGGTFTGLLSQLCGGKTEDTALPYYNKELRDSVRRTLSILVPELKDAIEREKEKKYINRAPILASVIRELFPEVKKYNDADLLDALRLELIPIGWDIDDIEWHKSGEIIFVFKEITQGDIIPEWKNGRSVLSELGYEDDAKIVNECIYREIIEKEDIARIITIEDYVSKNIDVLPREKLTPENTIGKKWIVLTEIERSST